MRIIGILSAPGFLGRSFASDLGLVPPRPGSLGWLYVGLLAAGAVVGIAIGQLAGPQEPAGLLLLFSLVIWQPVVEELAFRGIMQGVLLRTRLGRIRLAGLSGANGLTSLAFVVLHIVHQPWPWALAVFAPSLLFGYFRDRSGSVLPPLVMHVVFNLAFFLDRVTLF